MRTSSSSCSRASQKSSSGSRKIRIRSGSCRRSWHPVGERHAVVQAQQVGVVGGRLVLHQHDDVLDQGGDLVGHLVEGAVDERLELGTLQLHAPIQPDGATGPRQAGTHETPGLGPGAS